MIVCASAQECPKGCECLLEEQAKKLGYTPCDEKPILCGYDKFQTPLYCYKPPATPTPSPTPKIVPCPGSCTCMSPETAKKLGYGPCPNAPDPCGYDQLQNLEYCYQPPATPSATPTPTPTQLAIQTPVMIVTATPTATLPVVAPSMCYLSGNINNFWHDPETLQVRIQNAEYVPRSCSPSPPYLCTGPFYVADETSAPMNIAVSPVMSGDLVSHYSYLTRVSCSGTYLISPVYRAAGDACEWAGTWTPAIANHVVINGSSKSGYDFTFVPADAEIPEISITVDPAQPRMEDDLTVTILVNDNNPIARIRARADITRSDRTTVSHDWTTLPQTAGMDGSTAGARFSLKSFVPVTGDILSATIMADTCDSAGNERSAFLQVSFGSCLDGVLNRDETGVDCGGRYCPACISCWWCGDHVEPFILHGQPSDVIDVILIPADTYGGDIDLFLDDLQDAIENGYYASDIISANQEKINIYYMTDEAGVTAYPACGFTPPLDDCDDFGDAVLFADSIGVLHPNDFRDWAGTRCDRRVFTSEPTSYRTIVHESGHSLFGLKDEYCCDSRYSQNNPNPNIWSSESACEDDASDEGWDPNDCDDFCPSGSGNCGGGYWKIDPPTCVMRCSQSCGDNCCLGCGGLDAMCQYGEACLRRINAIFDSYP